MAERARLRRARMALAAIVVMASPAAADDPPFDDSPPGPTDESPLSAEAQRALEEIERMVRDLDTILSQIPRFGLPEMTEDGDILIPRLPTPPAPPTPPRPVPRGTEDNNVDTLDL